CRHSSRTSQLKQIFLASRVEPPFSGKKASGSVWAQSARSCHDSSPALSNNASSKSPSPMIGACYRSAASSSQGLEPAAPLPEAPESNDIHEITVLSLP